MPESSVSSRVTRISILGVPLDVVPDAVLEEVVLELATREAASQIVLIRWPDLLRARRDREYRSCLREAALVIPVSRSLQMAARMTRRAVPERYLPFSFVIRVLGALEERNRSVYIFGGQPGRLRTAEHNLRQTYPGLRFIGRYTGYYPGSLEPDIITGIRKASPDLLLVGPGVKGGDRWIYRNRSRIDSGLFLWSAEVFDVFSERRERVSNRLFARGLESLPTLIRRPWRVFRLFSFLWFLILLLGARLFRK